MRKFFGYILSPFVIIAFFLVLLVFQPIQWICYKLFWLYCAHKRSVGYIKSLSFKYSLFGRQQGSFYQQAKFTNRQTHYFFG